MMRVKYPLTDEAKAMARLLVDAWREGHIQQLFDFGVIDFEDSQTVAPRLGVSDAWDFPEYTLPCLLELSHFDLVVVHRDLDSRGKVIWEVLIMQELINAVESDFIVSDYFLTTQAVGTIIAADGDVKITGTVMGAASTYGDVTQTSNEIAEELRAILGAALQTNEELRGAVEELAVAAKTNRQSKLGKVISELGHCLEHGANAAGFGAALLYLSRLL